MSELRNFRKVGILAIRIDSIFVDTCVDGTTDQAGDFSGLDLIKLGTGSLCLGGDSDFT